MNLDNHSTKIMVTILHSKTRTQMLMEEFGIVWLLTIMLAKTIQRNISSL